MKKAQAPLKTKQSMGIFLNWHDYKEKLKEDVYKFKEIFLHVIIGWNLFRLDGLNFHRGKTRSCNHHLW